MSATSEAQAPAPAASAYDKHVEDANEEATKSGPNMSWSGRFVIFVLFPTLVGLGGLYAGYLETLRNDEKELSVDNDFVMPFLLALAFAVVVAFQTRGFSTKKVEPLVKWPKVRKKKVIRKVRKEDLDEGEVVDEKDAATKKDD